MKYFAPFLFMVMGLMGQPLQVTAQTEDASPVYLRVLMKDGSVFVGRRLAMTETELVMEMSSIGKVNLPLSDVSEIREIRLEETISKFSLYNRAANQGILGTTAFGLKRGEKQYSNFLLGFNQLGFGLSDRVSLYTGVEIFSILAGLGAGEFIGPGFFFRSHYAFPSRGRSVKFGTGVALGGFLGLPESYSALPYGVMTAGDEDNNFTAGIATGLISEINNPLLFTMAGNLRLSRSVGLATEHWISITGIDGLNTLNFAGVRFYGERISWKVSLVGVFSDFSFVVSPIPVAGAVLFFK